MNNILPSSSRSLRKFSAIAAIGILLHVPSLFAATFYIAPSGNDRNPGTQDAPFFSVMKAQAAAASGDTIYLRGGIYRITPNQISRTAAPYAYVNYLDKNGVSYLAYPGETPIFDFSFVTRPNYRITAFYVRGSNIYLKGFEVVGVQVTITVHTQSESFRVDGNNNTLELIKAHDGMANGIYINNHAANNLVLNCDCYNNWDSVSEAGFGGNTDGFGCHSTGAGNIFRQCRSWNNSDDGFDCINCAGAVTFDHCWSYSNGKQAKGDGNGFKIGGWGVNPLTVPPSPLPVHTVMYCLSANNKAHGFYANHQPGQAAVWTNNTSYNHAGGDFDTLERLSDMSADTPGTLEEMHDNLAFGGTITRDYAETGSIVSNNSWTEPVTVTAADFLSLDASQITAPRVDGNLPEITFMHPVSDSDIVGLGCF